MPPLVWLLTGCSSGFGHELTLPQALNRGDKVIATVRDASKLTALQAAGAVTLALDVTSPLATLKEVAKTANDQYGRIDILFNNAGMVIDGALEETTFVHSIRFLPTPSPSQLTSAPPKQ
ncbi:hypothetical protein FQN53_001809 [Emmonsiellopsis sp. PD_33]|nr:hypothetical protein FQN53_001809 [Emmonsiellopsis sp. PD_33]